MAGKHNKRRANVTTKSSDKAKPGTRGAVVHNPRHKEAFEQLLTDAVLGVSKKKKPG